MGGNKATATITPTSTLARPVVSEITAAAPEAKARTTESKPTSVRAINSWLETLSGQKMPIKMENNRAIASPAKVALIAFHIKGISPKAAPSARAILGPKSGAMTMAPITTATLSSNKPMATTTVERNTSRR